MLTAIGETKRQVEAAMSGDLDPAVCLREGGRVHALGTLLMKLGVRKGDEPPVLSPDDLQHLLGPEDAMERLARDGVKGLYFIEGRSLACMCGNDLPRKGDFVLAVIRTQTSVNELSARAEARGFQLVSPDLVAAHRKDFRSVDGAFWTVGASDAGRRFERTDEGGILRFSEKFSDLLYSNSVIILFRRCKPSTDIDTGPALKTLGSRLLQVASVPDKDPGLLKFSPDDVFLLSGPEGAEAMLRLARDGRRGLHVQRVKWMPFNTGSACGCALLEVARESLTVDRMICEARLNGLRVCEHGDEAEFQGLLRWHNVQGGYFVRLKNDQERRYVEVSEVFEPVGDPRFYLKKGERVLCYTQS